MATQITLQNGYFQDPEGNYLSGGTLVLQLTSDAVTTDASPEVQVMGGIPIIINLNSQGCVPSGTKIWSNAELSPSGTGYTAMAFTAAGARAWRTAQTWVFTQAGGSTVDLGTMVPTVNSVSYPTPIVGTPSTSQTISTFSFLPATGNTTQALGSSGAPWVFVGTTLNLSGNAVIGGTLAITGAVTLSSTLAVTGALTALSFNGLTITTSTGTLTVTEDRLTS